MDINTQVHQAYEVIQNGGIILFPTDTVWAIGCDATNEEAVAKIITFKQNLKSEGMICLMNGEKMLYNVFSNIPDVAWQIWDLSDKPTTLVLDKPRNIAKNLVATDNTLGVRLVKDPFCFKLMERMRRPLVATLANFSGAATVKIFSEISPEIKNSVDYIVDLQFDMTHRKPSVIIKITNDHQVKVIRK